MPKHRADCTECPWSYRDEDLVDVSDEMERHARKEHHHVDLQRAVATDGGKEINELAVADDATIGEFAEIAEEKTRGVDFLTEPDDTELTLVELSASYLDADGILRTFSVSSEGFDPDEYGREPSDDEEDPDVATDGGVDQAETGVTHEHRIEPGDVVYDLGQQGQLKLQVRRVLAESVAEYERQEDFDLSTYKHHSRLPVSRSDRVLECVYLPDDPGATPSEGNPYPVPAGRLARAPVELADEGHRIQDELRLGVLETMFRRAKSLDEDPGDAADTLVETVRLLAGDDCVELLDEAEELAEAARFGGGAPDAV
jgi:hypothetical protein